MRDLRPVAVRVLGLAALLTVTTAAVWAAVRGEGAPGGAVAALGLLLAVAYAFVRRESALRLDLAVPEDRRLPAPPWGWVVGATAGIGVVAASLAGDVPVAVLSGIVLAVALGGPVRPKPPSLIAARTARTARLIRSFARAHGVERNEPVGGYATPVGEFGTRLIVVAPDGAWADVMLGDDAELVTELARIDLAERTDQTVAQSLRIGRPLWTRMIESW